MIARIEAAKLKKEIAMINRDNARMLKDEASNDAKLEKEAMVMLNKWDGCCIGLPPTPFDSVEAAFAAPIAVKGMHVYRYGTIKGRMQVEPFAAGSFLLGLYRLEDAVMESSS